MPDISDFFPSGVVKFIAPPFDERFWANFGIPARVRVDQWGPSCQRGVAYANTGAPVASGTPGVVRKISTGRKARGYSSGDPRKDENGK